MSIEKRVMKVLTDSVGLSQADIKPNSDFVDDLGFDSLDVVETIMGLEEEFGIEIPDNDVEKFIKVKDVIDYITNRKGE
jgi:acyl carrier protein